MAIYGHIDPAGAICLFAPYNVFVASHLQMLEVPAPTPPFVDYVFGIGLMETLLWTVGSFCVCGEQLDLTLFLHVRLCLFEKTHVFHAYCLFAKIHHCHHHEFGKRLFLGGTAFIFRRRAFICLSFPLWKYGGLDSASSANKVARWCK